ncbi:MAG: tryptophan synthase subunit alpha [Spirochaetaceae bacterium]|jgi:tryptophan synthase alpha chain|nr:tryptophan synthase subunit alpha [Spirochaetaceae bacterium]
MSRIPNAFKDGRAFIGFVTGGDPSLEKTREFVLAMADAGADLVEIGVPFSDPIAEGPVIQEANLRALAGGTTVQKLFTLVEDLRRRTQIPLVFLTYLNPLFRMGYETFFRRAAEAGLDGVIIPDLPFEEQGEVRDIASAAGVDLISLIAPTSAERIRKIAAEAQGFVYLVSSLGVTGVRKEITTDLGAMAGEIRAAAGVPVAVGFGIHTPEQAADVARAADGVIVGSAIVKIIAEHGSGAAPFIAEYVGRMKAAVQKNEK